LLCSCTQLLSPTCGLLTFKYIAIIPTKGLVTNQLPEPYGYVAYNDSSQCTAHKALPSCFGPRLPAEELTGYLVKVTPPDACRAIERPPAPRKAPRTYIALIQARGCSFVKKVLHAQQAGYQIAVVHNVGSEQLVSMNADDKEIQQLIKIPSLFTGQSVSLHLQRILQCEKGAHVRILPPKRYLSHCEDSAGVLQGTLLTQDFRDMLCVVTATLSVMVALSWYKRAHKTKLHTYKQGDKYMIYVLCKAEHREGEHLR
ncbi:E3 ubiquitin-protein ligase RNF13, partial [Merops nubicus]